MSTQSRRVSCGLDFCAVPDMNASIQAATSANYHFVCLPIIHPRLKREFISGKSKNRPGAVTRSDLLLPSSDWNNLVVGKLSPYLNVDSKVEIQRKQSEQTLHQELNYASHLGLPAITFALHGMNNTNLARILHAKISAGAGYQVWVEVPMESRNVGANHFRSDLDHLASGDMESDNNKEGETWEWWSQFHLICNSERKLGVMLEVTADIPSDEVVERWLGEPVKSLVLSTALFLTNKKGFPVLSRAHQTLIRKFQGINVQLVLRGSNRHNNIRFYQQYLDHMWQNTDLDALGSFARGYEDYLQCPLQPLMDNLESQTYEVFEKDPVKYTEYQRAIYHVLLDKVGFENKEQSSLVVMVVGAGRGPLIKAAFNAASQADRKIKVYAVEKNPSAVITLQALQAEMWPNQVTVVSCDMREWNPPEKADLIVSELLGSFGDNELSPECLDGAQKFLKEDGVMIPQRYTSYISPIQSSKLYNEVRACQERNKHPLTHFETAYVVHLQNRTQLSSPLPLFTFHHPNRDECIDNTRYAIRRFRIQQKTVLHGFAGYFDTILYKDVMLSILPETHSPGMFSWFPIFFPIKDPVEVNAGDEIEVHFWRLTNKKNVWYEWCVAKPQAGMVHNPNGRSYTIGL